MYLFLCDSMDVTIFLRFLGCNDIFEVPWTRIFLERTKIYRLFWVHDSCHSIVIYKVCFVHCSIDVVLQFCIWSSLFGNMKKMHFIFIWANHDVTIDWHIRGILHAWYLQYSRLWKVLKNIIKSFVLQNKYCKT